MGLFGGLFGHKKATPFQGQPLPDLKIPGSLAEWEQGPSLGNHAQNMQNMVASLPKQAPKENFWLNFLGMAADNFAVRQGGQAMYTPMVMQRRQQAMQAQQQQAERQAKWDDWQRQYDYERNNPKPTRNDTIDDFNWYKSLSEPDRMIYDQQHPVVVQGPDGPYVVPRSAIRGSAPLGGSQVLGSTLPQGWTVQGGASAQPAGRPFRY